MKTPIILGLALLIANLSSAQNDRSKAEVFIQIEDRGNFTIQLDDETISSTKGKFRFYDVYSSTPVLSILQGNQKIYSKKVSTRKDRRLILNFSLRSGLNAVKELDLYRNGQYVLNDFDGYIGAYNTGIVPPRNTFQNFEELLSMVKREGFDDEKLKLIQIYVTHNGLTTEQTASLLGSFMRDENKLLAFKSIFPVILDPQRAYLLKDSFTFNDAKEQFLKHLNASSGQRPKYVMDDSSFEQFKVRVKKEAFDDQKTAYIQAATKQYKVTTAQVSELIRLYSFEDKALQLAKILYPTVVDRQRYFTLKETFKFVSNQNNFLDFLASNR